MAQTIIAAVEDGCPLCHAATSAGVSVQSISNWRESDPDFSEQIKQAVSRGIKARLDIVKRATQSKDEGVALRAATWWLTHVPGAAEHFSESRRIEVTGADGQPLAAAVMLYLPVKDDAKPTVETNGETRLIDDAS